MKKLALIMVLFLGVMTIASAQRGNEQRPSKGQYGQREQHMSPEQRVDQQVAKLDEQLKLSAEQKTKVKALLTANMEKQRAQMEKQREKMEQQREAMKNTENKEAQMQREKMRSEMQARMAKQDQEIKALLTDSQKAKYDEMVKKRQERMKESKRPEPKKE